jgi:hypothetical protein
VEPRVAEEFESNRFIHGYAKSKSIYCAIKKRVFNLLDWQFLGDNTVRWEYKNNSKNKKLFRLPNAYLIGYWTQEDYLETIRINLNNHLKFNCEKKLSKVNQNILHLIRKDTTLAIHVRGGDYSKDARLKDAYYRDAIDFYSKEIQTEKVFVFTNDFDYASFVLGDLDYEVVNHNVGPDSYIDMYLMSESKNLIMANSTFSWWASYLGNLNKSVIYPKEFKCISFIGWVGI